MLVEPILGDLDFTGGDGVIAFVNGMGGTPLIELYLMYNEVAAILAKAGVTRRPVARRLVHHQPRHGRLLGHAAQGRRRAAPALGRAGAARPACGGESERHGATTVDVDGADAAGSREFAGAGRARTRDLLTQLDSAIGDADHGANMDRGMTAVVAALDEQPPASAGGAAQEGRHDAGQHGRRRQRPAVRHAVPADGHGRRRARDARRARPSPRRCGPGSTASSPAARPRPATRRCSTRSPRPSTRSTPRSPAATPLGAALRGRRGRGRGGPRRDDPDAGPQGPRQLPRRAQRRPPGPRRDLRRRCSSRPPRATLG